MIESLMLIGCLVAASDYIERKRNPCPHCNGSGKVTTSVKSAWRNKPVRYHKETTKCRSCDGSGVKK